MVTGRLSTESNPIFPQNHLWADRASGKVVASHAPGTEALLEGDFRLEDGKPVKPAARPASDE